MTVSRRELRASLSVQGIPTERIDALCGPERAPRARRTGPTPEGQVLHAVLRVLRLHPSVAWAHRCNSGGAWLRGRDGEQQMVRFGWLGCSDILGQLTDGRFLAVEVKAPAGRVSEAQQAFLDQVRAAHGVAFVARSGVDAMEALNG